jgi:hypothetical protein
VKEFMEKYQNEVQGAINGWDRILFRGTQRWLSNAKGMAAYLTLHKILFKDFGRWAQGMTQRIRSSCEEVAGKLGRPMEYLRSSSISKEERAEEIAKRDKIKEGLICGFSVVEPCLSVDVVGNRATQQLEIAMRERKCVWVYNYWNDPVYGLCHARIQTWLPFTVKVCMNGRHWLARSLSREGIPYAQQDNAIAWVKDIDRAQELMDAQATTDWPAVLDSLRDRLCPAFRDLFGRERLQHYWSADETEWATDVLFHDVKRLVTLYPRIMRYAIEVFDSPSVLRFFGRTTTVEGTRTRWPLDLESDLRRRAEGVRIKHWLNRNSVKAYNKCGNVLRVETTINQPREFKVFRRPNDDRRRKLSWQKMRKGVADLHRRGEVSQACNNRYLEALAGVPSGQTVQEMCAVVCHRKRWNKQPIRALNLSTSGDLTMLQFIARGEHALNGFRNRDLRQILFPDLKTADVKVVHRASAATGRRLRLLRAHGLIHKIPGTHRYRPSPLGLKIAAVAIQTNHLDVEQLTKLAA